MVENNAPAYHKGKIKEGRVSNPCTASIMYLYIFGHVQYCSAYLCIPANIFREIWLFSKVRMLKRYTEQWHEFFNKCHIEFTFEVFPVCKIFISRALKLLIVNFHRLQVDLL